jgi:hypothetical protein
MPAPLSVSTLTGVTSPFEDSCKKRIPSGKLGSSFMMTLRMEKSNCHALEVGGFGEELDAELSGGGRANCSGAADITGACGTG